MQAGNNRVIFWYLTNLNDAGLVTGTRNPEFHRPTSQRGGTGCCFSPAPGNHGTYLHTYRRTDVQILFLVGMPTRGKKKEFVFTCGATLKKEHV
jgi:hypothetical protein